MNHVVETLEPLDALRERLSVDCQPKPPVRRCEHTGCITILNSWNNGRFCYAHEDCAKKEQAASTPTPPRPSGRKVDEEMAIDMYEWWRAGEGPEAIAAQFHIAPCTASRYIREQMRRDPDHKGRVTLRRQSSSPRAEARSTARTSHE